MSVVPLRLNPILLTAAASKGVSWKKVVRSSPAERFQTAEKVRISKLKISRKGGKLAKLTCESRTKGEIYVTEIQFLEPGNGDRVKLSCNCSDFVFRWEYALYRHGGADIRYGDGTAPIKTNPSLIPGCCKHIIAARWVAEERGLV